MWPPVVEAAYEGAGEPGREEPGETGDRAGGELSCRLASLRLRERSEEVAEGRRICVGRSSIVDVDIAVVVASRMAEGAI